MFGTPGLIAEQVQICMCKCTQRHLFINQGKTVLDTTRVSFVQILFAPIDI